MTVKKRSIKEAKVKCPKCNHEFTVREIKVEGVEPELLDEFWDNVDGFFDTVKKGFDKVFDPKFWK
jgi:hypothetical protein